MVSFWILICWGQIPRLKVEFQTEIALGIKENIDLLVLAKGCAREKGWEEQRLWHVGPLKVTRPWGKKAEIVDNINPLYANDVYIRHSYGNWFKLSYLGRYCSCCHGVCSALKDSCTCYCLVVNPLLIACRCVLPSYTKQALVHPFILVYTTSAHLMGQLSDID